MVHTVRYTLRFRFTWFDPGRLQVGGLSGSGFSQCRERTKRYNYKYTRSNCCSSFLFCFTFLRFDFVPVGSPDIMSSENGPKRARTDTDRDYQRFMRTATAEEKATHKAKKRESTAAMQEYRTFILSQKVKNCTGTMKQSTTETRSKFSRGVLKNFWAIAQAEGGLMDKDTVSYTLPYKRYCRPSCQPDSTDMEPGPCNGTNRRRRMHEPPCGQRPLEEEHNAHVCYVQGVL